MFSEQRTAPIEPMELTTVLLRHHGIHRGLWTLQVNFVTSGHNVVSADGETARPAVLVGVQSVCLRSVQRADELSVDAALLKPQT
jgi:hypothetical protein